MKNEIRRKELLRKLTIGIAAYNRWDGLKRVLEKLVEKGLEDVKVVIADDGSRQQIDFDLSAFPMPIRFERSEKSMGCVYQRNRIASLIDTEYYLSIDDDSYPVDGDVCDVIKSMDQDKEIAVMALDVRGPKDELAVNEAVSEPVDIRYFVLCGAIIRRDYFLEVGGFQNPDELGWIYNEELDYSIRCWRDGKKVMLDRRLVIVHDREFQDGEDEYKSSCYATGLGYLYGRYFRGLFAIFKILKMPFMFYRSPRTSPFWLKSVSSFIRSYKVGVRDRSLDQNRFSSKSQQYWDTLGLPPFA